MSLILRWQGATLLAGDTGLPPQAGHGDVLAARSGYADLVSYPQIANMTMANRQLTGVQFRNTGSVTYWRVEPDLYPSPVSSPVEGPYSIRLYYRRTANHSTQQPIIRVRQGLTTRLLFASNQNNAYVIPGLTGTATALSPTTSIYRMEIQVDPDRSPKVVWRIYLEDETTALRNRTANPSSTVWDNILVGHFTSGMVGAPLLDYGDIEIHDDYDLGGQFTDNPASPAAASVTAVGAPSANPVIEPKYNYNPSTNRTDPAASPSFTTFNNVDYAVGANRTYSIYVPDGTPPAGGWPVVVWAHSGFFTSGSKFDLPSNWRDDLLNAGYAVATVEYVLSSIAAGSYPSYPSAGQYPSHIMDFKRAALHIQEEAATYGINPDKLVASGFSAGGYIALGAVLSRDLAQDANGTPMSLAAATTAGHSWGHGYTGPDPEFKGCFVYAGATDLEAAVAFDPTRPNAGSIMVIAYRAFLGLVTGTAVPSAPHTRLHSIAAENNVDLPIAYVRGTSDYLVHWEHAQNLATQVTFDEFTAPNNHDSANQIYDRDLILGWLDQLFEEDSGVSVGWWDGTTEVPVNLSWWDGTTEIPVTLEG